MAGFRSQAHPIYYKFDVFVKMSKFGGGGGATPRVIYLFDEDQYQERELNGKKSSGLLQQK